LSINAFLSIAGSLFTASSGYETRIAKKEPPTVIKREGMSQNNLRPPIFILPLLYAIPNIIHNNPRDKPKPVAKSFFFITIPPEYQAYISF
jgi:hypothetical protein